MSAPTPGLEVAVDRRPDPTHDDELTSILTTPGFGQRFTDHMLLAEWTPERGWHDARVTAYGPLSLDPATAVLHYAQEIIVGLQACSPLVPYTSLFRPEANGARLARSAQRL